MPKIKTRKSVAKKIKVTGKGKAMRQYSKQNHYNSRETGKFKRFKRKQRRVHKTDEKNVLRALPYN